MDQCTLECVINNTRLVTGSKLGFCYLSNNAKSMNIYIEVEFMDLSHVEAND